MKNIMSVMAVLVMALSLTIVTGCSSGPPGCADGTATKTLTDNLTETYNKNVIKSTIENAVSDIRSSIYEEHFQKGCMVKRMYDKNDPQNYSLATGSDMGSEECQNLNKQYGVLANRLLPPSWDDKDRNLLGKALIEKIELTIDAAKKKVTPVTTTLSDIVTEVVNKDAKSCICSATANYSDGKKSNIRYKTQRTEDGKILVFTR